MGAKEEKRVLRLEVEAIRPNPRQPRRLFDEAGVREPSGATASCSR